MGFVFKQDSTGVLERKDLELLLKFATTVVPVLPLTMWEKYNEAMCNMATEIEEVLREE